MTGKQAGTLGGPLRRVVFAFTCLFSSPLLGQGLLESVMYRNPLFPTHDPMGYRHAETHSIDRMGRGFCVLIVYIVFAFRGAGPVTALWLCHRAHRVHTLAWDMR
jgi:hypothetical protein